MNVIKTKRHQLQIFIYQKIADLIIEMMKTASDNKVGRWFDIGMNFNANCIKKEIYLK